ncbi:MAG: LysE family translocator [Burkholderiaceae bacterium]|jgi:threonine/homoserine/homoserine lactone efflux protein|nr:LysE family translocator [Burkholderiaceae bacterium]
MTDLVAALGIHDLLLFIAAGLLLNITPGPDLLLIIGRATAQGVRAGVAAAFGIAAGCLVHTAAVALGVAALLVASSAAFELIKWAGAAYLAWLGLRLLLSNARATAAAVTPPPATLAAIFRQGFITNVLNPKVALFFLALLPQFVAPDAPAKALALALLGVVFALNSLLVIVPVAWLAGRAGRRLRGDGAAQRWLDRALGALFLGLALRLALARPH